MWTSLLLALVAVAGAVSGPQALEQWRKEPSRWVNGVPDKTTGPVGIYYWSTSCVPCADQSHVVAELAARWGSGVNWIAVHVPRFEAEREPFTVEQAAHQQGLAMPVFRDRGRVQKAFRIERLPAFHFWQGGRLRLTAASQDQWRELPARLAGVLGPASPHLVEESAPGVLRFPEKMILGPPRPEGKWALVADTGNHRVIGISLEPGQEGALVWEVGQRGKPGWRDGSDAPLFFHPRGLWLDGDNLFVADTGNHRVRQVNLSSKRVSTVMGTGAVGTPSLIKNKDPLTVSLHAPWDLVALRPHRWIVSVAGSHQLLEWNRTKNTVSTFSGTGTRSSKDGAYPRHGFAQPSGLAVHQGQLFVVDALTSSLRTLTLQGEVKTLLGSKVGEGGFKDGPKGELQYPLALVSTSEGLVIADSFNHALRRWGSNGLETIAGQAGKSALRHLRGMLWVNPRWLIADTFHHRLVWLNPQTEQWTRLLVHRPLKKSTALDKPRI